MADISTKMSVTGISQYKSAMSQAQASVKTLDAELKKNEAAYKASGDKEKYMEERTKLLNDRMKAQKAAAQQAEQALKAMRDQGIDPASTSYQKMQQALLQAQTGALETTASLNELAQGAQTAASGADTLTASVNGINKKVSLDAVTNGLDSIKSGLEGIASKAVEVGKALWDEILNRAQWADDTATAAQIYGIELDRYLRMLKLFEGENDSSVDAILTAQTRLKRGVGNDTKAVADAFAELNISMYEWQTTAGQSGSVSVMKDSNKLFWEAGKAILGMSDAYKQEAYAQAIFGRSWKELVPLFKGYKDEEAYEEALNGLTVQSEDSVTTLAALNDEVAKLKSSFTTLEDEVLTGIAPALTGAAEVLSTLLNKLTEYLKTEKGQEMLERMEKAVSGLFEDLAKIDPEKVVENFVSVFTTLIEKLEWLDDNKEAVGAALGFIVSAWGAVTIGKTLSSFMTFVSGLTGLGAAGAATAAGEAGAAAGASWGGAFATAALKAAPWLAFLYTLLNPGTAEDSSAFSDDEMQKLANDTADKETKKAEAAYDVLAHHKENGIHWDFTHQRYVDKDGNPFVYTGEPVDKNDSSEQSRQSGPRRKRNITGQAAHIGSGDDPWPKPIDVEGYFTGMAAARQGELDTILNANEEYWAEKVKWAKEKLGWHDNDKETETENEEAGSAAAQAFISGITEYGKNAEAARQTLWDTLFGGENGEPAEVPVKPVMADDDEDIDIWDLLEDPVPMPTTPEVDVGAAQEQLNTAGLVVPVTPQIYWGNGSVWGSSGGAGGGGWKITQRANGLPFVPWDGYPAILHRGERIMTASQNANYTYNSNTYFGNVNLNNGLEIDALSESIARQNKKHQAGYGS